MLTPKGRGIWRDREGIALYVVPCGQFLEVDSDLLGPDEVVDFHLITCERCNQ